VPDVLLFFGVDLGRELGLKLRDLLLQFVWQLLGVAGAALGGLGDFVEPAGGDADLFGGRADRARQGLQRTLPVVECLVLLSLVGGDKRDQSDDRAQRHEADDGKHRVGRQRLRAIHGDEARGGDKRRIGGNEDPGRQFGIGDGGIHGGRQARPEPTTPVQNR
jgi:hypothetical protein